MRIETAHLGDGVRLPVLMTDSHPCPYLPDRAAREQLLMTPVDDGAFYQQLMDWGFRRSERFFYRPSCEACSACVPIRIPVERFAPSRSQLRVLRRNRDVEVRVAAPTLDAERWDLFNRYQVHAHDKPMLRSPEEYVAVFCDPPIDAVEMSYYVAGRLVGVGVLDVCPDALSSVYFYYDPRQGRRSLGVFSGMCEIEACRARGRPWWYLGFFVAGCRKMEYKSRFRPFELLDADGVWRAPRDDTDGAAA